MSLEIKIINADDPKGVKTVRDIRKKVFTEEQGIPFELDDDGYDQGAVHVLAFEDSRPAGVGRLVIKEDIGVLARIAVMSEYRGKGYAGQVVSFLEKEGKKRGLSAFELYPHAYLEKFYAKLGYKTDDSYKSAVAGHDLIRMYK